MRHLLIACLMLVLAGCKVDLYTNLSEREANEMLAVLMSNGISAQKQYIGEEGVNVRVEETDLPRAINALKENGFPRENRDSIGKIFEKSGIMSSPFEERVRFVYGLGEEVSKTLSEIDGVLTARVHIVLPEDPDLGEAVTPSSAAVFIKHRAGVDLDFFTPQIRRLVSNAIEGVEYENVTVVLVEAERPQVMSDTVRTPVTEILPGLAIRESDTGLFWQLAIGVGVALFFLVVTNIIAIVGFARARGARLQAETAMNEQVQPGE
ncbi:MAG: type III secretion inner membrane ring lipoprotein SctJ [Pseudomonadota bacterium]